MDVHKLRALLTELQAGRLEIDQALEQLRRLPYDDLGYANLDLHRSLRQGLPEVVFGQGKTAEQLVGILERLWQHHDRIMATRVSKEMAVVIQSDLPQAHYDLTSRLLTLARTELP